MEQTKLLSRKSYLWLGVFFGVLIWSGIEPKDRLTWVLEAGPAIIGLLVIAKTRISFPLTPLLYFWILLHCVVLMVGAKYTYAEVPLFDWISEMFGWERNNYDKIGHFMQGFVPALLSVASSDNADKVRSLVLSSCTCSCLKVGWSWS